MDFRELTYILAIAKHQTITKAAESLYVSQPTLSKFLIALENELGQKLFRKVGHKYILTYAGERYTARAREILRLKKELDTELDDMLNKDVGVLNVAFPNMRCTYMLPVILPEFRKRHPNVKVNLFEGDSDRNDQRILEGQVEIAFYSKPNTLNPQLFYETLGEEELLICVPKDHPVRRYAVPNPHSRYPRLDPDRLKDELVLRMMPNQRTRQITDDYFRDHGLSYKNEMYTSSMPTIMELVAVGYGVSFLFETHLRHRQIQTPIDCYSFGETRITSDFVAVYRKDSYLSHYAREFIDLARQMFENDSVSST